MEQEASIDEEIAEFEAQWGSILPGQVGGRASVPSVQPVPVPPLFQKEDLVGEFLSLNDADAKWFLAQAAKQRRGLFNNVLTEDAHVSLPPIENQVSKPAVTDTKPAATKPTVTDSKPTVTDGQPCLTNGDAAGGHRMPTFKAKPSLTGAGLRRSATSINFEAASGDMREADAQRAKQEPPMVQFSAFMYFCNETENTMTLDVMRIGDLSGTSTVYFSTRDATALAGHRYVKTAGEITFDPGDSEKDITIPILFTETWDTTTEFAVDLIKDGPGAPVGCTLGRYLWTTRVKVIDNGCFPSEKFHDQILERDLENVGKWSLIWEYFKLNYSLSVVRKGTIKTVLLGSCHNMYLLLKLFMNVYLVDTVLQIGKPGASPLLFDSQEASLIILGALLIMPFIFLHWGDVKEPAWKVGGASRALLQKALLRKFLNYCETARSELKQGDLTMAMTRDSVNLVHEGYMNFLDMIESTGTLFSILIFLCLAPPLLNTRPRIGGFVIMASFPLLLISFLLMRQKRTTNYVHSKERCQDALVGQVDRTVTNYRMIADYNRRPFFVARYEARIKDLNKAAIFEAQILRNNSYCPKWLTVTFLAGYTVIGGLQVVDLSEPEDTRLSLGMFLANLNVIATTGTAWGDIYRVLLDMQRVFPALECIVTLLNLPIDVPQRMILNRFRRQKTSDLRAELRTNGCKGLPLDYLPITLVNVEYSYGNKARPSKGMSPTKSISSAENGKKMTTKSIDGDTGDNGGGINSKGKMTVSQGTLVSLVGPRGEGKSTILKIIGGVILPQPGSFFIPSHLRVLHMSSDPLFFMGSLYENLTFGITPGDPDGEMIRVNEICRRLDLPDRLLNVISEGMEGDKLIWGEVLSFTQKNLLCLARSLVTNPEVLCIHKPTMSYDENTSVRVLNLLKEFVTDKGVMQDPKTRHRRRPRTCIFTSSKIQGVDISDEVYLVSKGEGIRSVDKASVSADMLG